MRSRFKVRGQLNLETVEKVESKRTVVKFIMAMFLKVDFARTQQGEHMS
jgi:hypothetical protein